MRGERLDADPVCAGFDNVPNHILRNAIPPSRAVFAYRSKQLAAHDGNAFRPGVNRALDPGRNGNRTYMARLAYEVDYRPMIFTALDIADIEPNDLGTPQTASKQERDHGGITLPSECLKIET
jgi:hypothetical protein